jgi:anaerobic selenocysteine-containing dehydrogenase
MQLVHQAPPFPQPDPEYPLQLAALSVIKAQASQWSVAAPAVPVARVHPSLLAAHGAEALLETRHGQQRVQLEADEAVHPSMVVMDKGGMLRQGGSPNQLIAAAETDLGGGAAYYDEPVRLSAVPPSDRAGHSVPAEAQPGQPALPH